MLISGIFNLTCSEYGQWVLETSESNSEKKEERGDVL